MIISVMAAFIHLVSLAGVRRPRSHSGAVPQSRGQLSVMQAVDGVSTNFMNDRYLNFGNMKTTKTV